MFSAYDLKKIIPRAIFALVLVNLSWGLMEIFIRGVDVVGKGAEELVMAPFGDIGRGIEIGASSGAAVFTLTAVGAAGAAFGLIPILGVAITGLFGILFAFVITLIRRVFLIGLVIIAPVAIALSVFPQTESWAKKWWDWFSKLLLMYPFIMAFFGLSKVSAGIISKARGTDVATDIMYDLAAIALLILPYFLVGKALSLAGGAIGKVAGMVNNKDKGVIDWAKKKEAAKVSERRADAKAGVRYQDKFGFRTINRGLGLGANRGSNARLQDSFQRRVGGFKEAHPESETLSGAEARLLAESQGSESKMKDAMEEMAQEMVRESDGKVRIAEARSMVKMHATSAKRKVGGNIDAAAAAVGLQKAVEAGSISEGQVIERLAAGVAQAAGGTSAAHIGTDMAKNAKSAAIRKQEEILNTQTMAINQAEQAGNFALADKIRKEAGYEFEVEKDAAGVPTGVRRMVVANKGTAANLRSLGRSDRDPENKNDLGATSPVDYHTAGRSYARPENPETPGGPPGPSTAPPTAPPPPTTTTTAGPTPPHPFTVGTRVRSAKGATGTVSGIASDGNPLVTYDGTGSPVAYTKPENLKPE